MILILMSKRSRGKKRNKSAKIESNVIVMVVEGQTEENYLNYLNKIFGKGYKLRIKLKSKLNKDIEKDIRRYAEMESIDEEELVLIYDLENSAEEKKKFISNGKLKHEKTYLVQSCIETHFLMHHQGHGIPCNNYHTAEDALIKLKRVLPSYEKGAYSWNQQGITKEHVLSARDTANKQFNNYDQHSFSMIGKLIDDYFDL